MKIYFVSLGCDKNLVDTEHMIALLSLEPDMSLTEDPAQADAIVINTCCFIGDAKEESIETILEMAAYKETGHLQALLVAGCLGQRYAEEFAKELPEVDGILGTNAWDEIVPLLRQTVSGEKATVLKPFSEKKAPAPRKLTVAGSHYGYLKIAEGCNKNCAYCVIPSVRGPYRSVPMEELLSEAKDLTEAGVKELILVAQETSVYGVDLYGEKRLPALLDRLNELPGLVWIRVMYCYPEEIDESLIAAIKRNEKVCHYLDMPIQHCSDRILKAMNRRTRKEELTQVIAGLREAIPDICLRTTIMTGFPGETEEDYAELLDFVKTQRFDRLGCFPYSQEEGTQAADMDGQVAEETKQERAERLMALAKEISLEKNKALLGRAFLCMVEGYLPEDGVYVARTERDAPEIDSYVFFESARSLMTGDFVNIRIKGCDAYDLHGEEIL